MVSTGRTRSAQWTRLAGETAAGRRREGGLDYTEHLLCDLSAGNRKCVMQSTASCQADSKKGAETAVQEMVGRYFGTSEMTSETMLCMRDATFAQQIYLLSI